jgi:hypothetical protein
MAYTTMQIRKRLTDSIDLNPKARRTVENSFGRSLRARAKLEVSRMISEGVFIITGLGVRGNPEMIRKGPSFPELLCPNCGQIYPDRLKTPPKLDPAPYDSGFSYTSMYVPPHEPTAQERIDFYIDEKHITRITDILHHFHVSRRREVQAIIAKMVKSGKAVITGTGRRGHPLLIGRTAQFSPMLEKPTREEIREKINAGRVNEPTTPQ